MKITILLIFILFSLQESYNYYTYFGSDSCQEPYSDVMSVKLKVCTVLQNGSSMRMNLINSTHISQSQYTDDKCQDYFDKSTWGFINNRCQKATPKLSIKYSIGEYKPSRNHLYIKSYPKMEFCERNSDTALLGMTKNKCININVGSLLQNSFLKQINPKNMSRSYIMVQENRDITMKVFLKSENCSGEFESTKYVLNKCTDSFTKVSEIPY
jgi:hypothetical protein